MKINKQGQPFVCRCWPTRGVHILHRPFFFSPLAVLQRHLFPPLLLPSTYTTCAAVTNTTSGPSLFLTIPVRGLTASRHLLGWRDNELVYVRIMHAAFFFCVWRARAAIRNTTFISTSRWTAEYTRFTRQWSTLYTQFPLRAVLCLCPSSVQSSADIRHACGSMREGQNVLLPHTHVRDS